jgi:hypothetical protein
VNDPAIMAEAWQMCRLEAAKIAGHFSRMNRIPPTLDMLPDGRFRSEPRPTAGVPISAKLMVGAVLVAVVAGAISVAALALWLLSLALPVLILAGVGAWAAYRFRRWQLLRGARDLRPL